MAYKTRLPELKFSIDEATILAVLTEWIRETYEIADRDYDINFNKVVGLHTSYDVTATFKDAKPEARRSFSEVLADARPPFTLTPGVTDDTPST